jgi:hypothetical protein
MSPDPRTIAGFQRLQKALQNAATDPDLRQRLLENPREMLAEAELEIPDDVELVVHENSSKRVHLVIPSRVMDWDELDIEAVNVVLILECGF